MLTALANSWQGVDTKKVRSSSCTYTNATCGTDQSVSRKFRCVFDLFPATESVIVLKIRCNTNLTTGLRQPDEANRIY